MSKRDEHIIKFEDVNFAYGSEPVLNKISFTIKTGEFVCLTGKSGCGKSTLLRLINGLLKSSSGSIEIMQKNIEDWNQNEMRRNMGFVLQEAALFPHLNNLQNMQYCLNLIESSKENSTSKVYELLELVKLPDEILNKFPEDLSGGQKQRVAIVRALAHNPKIVLMDEPFSALDPETRESLQLLVKDIHKKLGTTFIMVTHSLEEAKKLATRVVKIDNGKIID